MGTALLHYIEQAPRRAAEAPVNKTRWMVPGLEEGKPAEEEIENLSDKIKDPSENIAYKIDDKHGALL